MTVVVKFGSSLVVGRGGHVRRGVLRARGREIRRIVRRGEPVCVVSSGAIALGLPRLGLDRRPRSISRLQAASALGQARLQAAWDQALAPLHAAQVLLTAADIGDRTTYVNARGALEELLGLGAVPVVNENDATATDEITFGDNDALAAQVAVLLRARLLVLLTEVAGVYSRAPGHSGCGAARRGQSRRRGRARRSQPARARWNAQQGPRRRAGRRRRDPDRDRRRDRATRCSSRSSPASRAGRSFAAAERNEPAFKLWLRFGKPVRGRHRRRRGAHRALVDDGASLLGGRRRRLRGHVRGRRRRRARRSGRLGVRQGDRVASRPPSSTTGRGASRSSTVTAW